MSLFLLTQKAYQVMYTNLAGSSTYVFLNRELYTSVSWRKLLATRVAAIPVAIDDHFHATINH